MEKRYTALEWAAMEGGNEIPARPAKTGLSFINELTEARLFRSVTAMEGRDAKDLAIILFLSVLSLEIIRHDDEDTARRYAQMTLQFGDFDHMRSSSSDMANIISVLSNQDKYEDRIKTNFDVSAPVLQLKTYLRGVWQGVRQNSRDRQFFISLEGMLDISDSMYRQLRRDVGDWHSASDNERKNAINVIKRELSRRAVRLDLVEYLP